MRGVSESYRGKQVRVFRLDRTGVVARLDSAAGRLMAAQPEVLQITLFGSLARGDAAPGSDADLLIIVRDGAARFLERAVALSPYFDGVGVGCDLFVYTESEVSRLATSRSIVRTALEEGMRIGEREA